MQNMSENTILSALNAKKAARADENEKTKTASKVNESQEETTQVEATEEDKAFEAELKAAREEAEASNESQEQSSEDKSENSNESEDKPAEENFEAEDPESDAISRVMDENEILDGESEEDYLSRVLALVDERKSTSKEKAARAKWLKTPAGKKYLKRQALIAAGKVKPDAARSRASKKAAKRRVDQEEVGTMESLVTALESIKDEGKLTDKAYESAKSLVKDLILKQVAEGADGDALYTAILDQIAPAITILESLNDREDKVVESKDSEWIDQLISNLGGDE